MREVKYRAWVERKKVLVDVLSIDFKERTVRLPIQTPVTADYWWDETTWNFEDVVLMQYTGLKDKNGREIYEKDVAEIKHTYDYMAFDGYERSWTITKGEVAFNYAGFDVKYLDRDGEPVWSGITLMECLSDMVSEWEVIGNVFENAEILEDK